MSVRGQILYGMPGPYNPDERATEQDATDAVAYLEKAIEAARNSNQAGENAVVKAARAIGFKASKELAGPHIARGRG